MPNKTIYIRKEDESLWNNLEDKAEAVSKMLRKESSELGGKSYTTVGDGKLKEVKKPQPKIREVNVPEIDMIRVSSEHALDSITGVKRASEPTGERKRRVYSYETDETIDILPIAEAQALAKSNDDYRIELQDYIE